MSPLEKITHICLIGVSVIASFVLIQQYVAAGHLRSGRGAPADFVGKRLSLSGAAWRPRNILVAMSPHCHFCLESVPLYRRLAAVANRNAAKASVVFVTNGPKTELQDLLSAQNVSASGVVEASFSTIGVRGTPTLLLVDGRGVVADAFVGVIPPEREARLLAFLGGGS